MAAAIHTALIRHFVRETGGFPYPAFKFGVGNSSIITPSPLLHLAVFQAPQLSHCTLSIESRPRGIDRLVFFQTYLLEPMTVGLAFRIGELSSSSRVGIILSSPKPRGVKRRLDEI
jgi:hypothetical protein